MSQKTAVVFCLWTAVWCAVFYFIYEIIFGSFNVPWVMFVCMTIFFAIQMKPKQLGAAMVCYFCGLAWGALDYILIYAFTNMGFRLDVASFIALVIGTFGSMYIHMKLLQDTPFHYIAFVFAGVCSMFSQNGGNIVGLVITSVWGILLAALCALGLIYCSKRWPYEGKKKKIMKKESQEVEAPETGSLESESVEVKSLVVESPEIESLNTE